MGQRNLSRRELMEKSGAAATVAALASTAGCIGTVRDAVPFIGGATYKSWLPEPGTITDSDHYSFSYLDLNTVEENEDEFSDDTDYSNIEEIWRPADLDWEDANWLVFFRGGRIVNADYNQDDVAGDLEDNDFDDDTDHQGYTIYLGPNERRAFAIDGSNMILTSGENAVDNAEAIIDTDGGDEDRYVDESEDMNTLVGALGGGTLVSGRTMEAVDQDNPEQGQFENMVGRGRRMNVNGSTTDGKYVVVYEDSDDVDTGDLEDWVETSQDNDGRFAEWDDLNYNSNGRKGIIKGKVDTDEL